MKKTIAIIGYGRFGRFAAHHLKKKFRVFVADWKKTIRVEPGINKISMQEAAKMGNIILAVPINALPSLLRTIAPLLKPGTLVCDVSSVKEEPIRWMKSILPGYVSILGTHPLFGPDSATGSFTGKTIVLCPVRISSARLRNIRRHLNKEGLIVQQMTPTKHDQLMASTLFLTQFIGRAVHRLNLPPPTSSTHNFELLHYIASTSQKDSKELFHDMYRFNRYARKTPEQLLKAVQKLSHILEVKS